MPTRKYADTFLFTLANVVIVPRKTVFELKKTGFGGCPFLLGNTQKQGEKKNDRISPSWSVCYVGYIWVEPARKGKGQKIGNFTLYVLGSLNHLYIFCFAGNCHMFEAYRGESYYGI